MDKPTELTMDRKLSAASANLQSRGCTVKEAARVMNVSERAVYIAGDAEARASAARPPVPGLRVG